jgi:hypothetical protein
LQPAEIGRGENNFRRAFKLPASLVGRREVQVVLSADRVLVGADGSQRSVVFGTISMEKS